MIKRLYDPDKNGIMQVVGLMSGSGSNLRKIIEFERKLIQSNGKSPYHIAAIFSDNPRSNAQAIGKEYHLPVLVRDIMEFYQQKKQPRTNMGVREEFDRGTVYELTSRFELSAAAYAGYMSIASKPLIDAFIGVNVHPADLSKMQGDRRKFTGGHAVRDAILAGESQLRSTTHLVSSEVDQGGILMISNPVQIILPEGFDKQDSELVKRISDEHQNKLKEVGDWEIFPKTLQLLASGRFSRDEEHGWIYFDNKIIPTGLRMEFFEES